MHYTKDNTVKLTTWRSQPEQLKDCSECWVINNLPYNGDDSNARLISRYYLLPEKVSINVVDNWTLEEILRLVMLNCGIVEFELSFCFSRNMVYVTPTGFGDFTLDNTCDAFNILEMRWRKFNDEAYPNPGNPFDFWFNIFDLKFIFLWGLKQDINSQGKLRDYVLLDADNFSHIDNFAVKRWFSHGWESMNTLYKKFDQRKHLVEGEKSYLDYRIKKETRLNQNLFQNLIEE